MNNMCRTAVGLWGLIATISGVQVFGQAAQEPLRIRVLSYNIHHGEGVDGQLDLPRIAAIIKGVNPDLVALQELDEQTTRTGQVRQTAELMQLTGLQGHFGKAIPFAGGEYGQALLSKYPLRETTVHDLPTTRGDEQRIALSARVTIQGRELTFVSTHLSASRSEDRERQAQALNDLFGSVPTPVILAGDLNATPDSPVLNILRKSWKIPDDGEREFPTIPVANPRRQIDYVLFRPAAAFKVLELRVLAEPVASDHLPLLAELELGNP